MLVAGAGFAQNPTPVPPAAPPPVAPAPATDPAARRQRQPAAAKPAVAATAPAAAAPAPRSSSPIPCRAARSSPTSAAPPPTSPTGSRDGVWQNSRVVVLHKGRDRRRAEGQVPLVPLGGDARSCRAPSQVAIYDSVRFSKAPKDSLQVAVRRPTGTQQSTLRAIGIRGRVGMSYQYVGGPPDSTGQARHDLAARGRHPHGRHQRRRLEVLLRARHPHARHVLAAPGRELEHRPDDAGLPGERDLLGSALGHARHRRPPVRRRALDDQPLRRRHRRGGQGALVLRRASAATSPTRSRWAIPTRSSSTAPSSSCTRGPSPPRTRRPPSRWSVTMGGIDSYDNGAINREFMFVQGFYADRHLTVFATQEVDYNRGWKQTLGYPTLDPVEHLHHRESLAVEPRQPLRRLRQPEERPPLARFGHAGDGLRRCLPRGRVGGLLRSRPPASSTSAPTRA